MDRNLRTLMALAERSCEDAINDMIHGLAETMPGIPPTKVRDPDGSFVLAPLLAARAHLLASMADYDVAMRRRVSGDPPGQYGTPGERR